MYTSFEIKNFRCFDDLKIDGLERVNLIAGTNNVGKTSLLEAMFIHVGNYRPNLVFTVNALRGMQSLSVNFVQSGDESSPWETIFHNFESKNVVEIAGKEEKNGEKVIRLKELKELEDLEKAREYLSQKNIEVTGDDLRKGLELEHRDKDKISNYYLLFKPTKVDIYPIPPSAPFQGIFLSTKLINSQDDITRYSELEKMGKMELLLEALRIIEPRLKKLSLLFTGAENMIHGDIGLKHLAPLAIMGEGMNRILRIIVNISVLKNGVVFIDEVENGIHHTKLVDIWKVIAKAAREFNTQVFATTHSYECLVAAHEAFSASEKYDFRLHRLENIKGKIKAITLNQEALDVAIKSNMEVR